MTTPQTSHGAGAEIVPELLMREVLTRGIAALRRDEIRQRELFRRVDTELDYNSAEDTENDWVHYFTHELSNIGHDNALRLGLGYPEDAQMLPYISIIDESTTENGEGATCADVAHVAYETQGTVPVDDDGYPDPLDWTGYKVIRHERLNTDHTTNVQIGCWCTGPEQALLVAAVVNQILTRDRGRMERAGVYETTTSEGGMTPPAEYLQMGVRYVPIISVRVSWRRRQTRRSRVANRSRVTASFTTETL